MKPKSKSRRAFLLTAGATGAGAAVAAVAARKQAEVPGASAQAQDAPDGYHVTEHIQKYYKTTEV
jgi:hypothetical protein